MYEAHITFNDPAAKVEPHVIEKDWSFSKIDGDIELGEGYHCYATKHFDNEAKAISDTIGMAHLFKDSGLTVIRYKVEYILYDVRWGF